MGSNTIAIAMIVGVALFGLLVTFMIPTLIHMQQLIRETRVVLAKVRQLAPPILEESRHTMRNLNQLSDDARRAMERIAVFVSAVEEVGREIRGLVQQRGHEASSRIRRVWKGVLAASAALMRSRSNQGGTHNGH